MRDPWWLAHWVWMTALGTVVLVLTLLFQSLGIYPR
jgi:hypothetical protein